MQTQTKRLMKNKLSVISLIAWLILSLYSCDSPNKASENAILLYNTNIISIEDGNIQKKKAILIDSGEIKSIGEYHILKDRARPENHFNYEWRYLIETTLEITLKFCLQRLRASGRYGLKESICP